MATSERNERYFIDGSFYNCPFCHWKGARYELLKTGFFNWNKEQPAYFYLVQCRESGCGLISFHLSHYYLKTHGDQFAFPPAHLYFKGTHSSHAGSAIEEVLVDDSDEPVEMDDAFFFHQPP